MTKEKFREIQEKHDPHAKKCRECHDVIFYKNSIIRISKDQKTPYYPSSSYDTHKDVLGMPYPLLYCEDCMVKFDPDFVRGKNYFNTMNAVTATAFGITPEVMAEYNVWRGNSEKSYIKRYGPEVGAEKFAAYREAMRYLQTLERYIAVYGEVEGQ